MSEQNDDVEKDEPRREGDAPPPGQAPVDDPSTGEDEPAEDEPAELGLERKPLG